MIEHTISVIGCPLRFCISSNKSIFDHFVNFPVFKLGLVLEIEKLVVDLQVHL